MGNIDAIRALGSSSQVSPMRNVQKPSEMTGPSFKDTLSGFLKDVNAMHLNADDKVMRMAAGEITDVHQVMNAAEEAKTAFNMMMEMRNRVMTAYEEVMRMRL
ncbi:MAG: flagellar hook-basal body complex protein FliE [Chitinivibrionia bacterium]|jgi:flagellar hook-basal body complex protein FliE|nr:flagellar hook-basal body complex protein FliE [Chitinivibrionia bacterium]